MKFQSKVQTLRRIVIGCLHKSCIVINLVFAGSQRDYQRILIIRSQKILNLKICRNPVSIRLIITDFTFGNKTLSVHTADLISDSIDFASVCSNRHRQDTLIIHRRDRITHRGRIHLRDITVQLVDCSIPFIEFHNRKCCLRKRRGQIFIILIGNYTKKNDCHKKKSKQYYWFDYLFFHFTFLALYVFLSVLLSSVVPRH